MANFNQLRIPYTHFLDQFGVFGCDSVEFWDPFGLFLWVVPYNKQIKALITFDTILEDLRDRVISITT